MIGPRPETRPARHPCQRVEDPSISRSLPSAMRSHCAASPQPKNAEREREREKAHQRQAGWQPVRHFAWSATAPSRATVSYHPSCPSSPSTPPTALLYFYLSSPARLSLLCSSLPQSPSLETFIHSFIHSFGRD